MTRSLVTAGFVLVGFTLPAKSADPTVHEAVTYRVVDGRELKLDIAIPAEESRHPAIVFLHGGAWVLGDRSFFRGEIEEAAKRGFVAATVSYRLAKAGPGWTSIDGFPAPLVDVKASIRFLRANAEQFQIDPERIGVAGASAGGHLALLAGLTRAEDGFDDGIPPDAPPSEVQAVFNAFGPTELHALANDNPNSRPILVILLGGAPELVPERYTEASPVKYAHRNAPPIMTVHGAHDSLVPLTQAHHLDQALKAAGANHKLVVLPGGHGFVGRDLQRLRATYIGFFRRTLTREAP